MNQHILIFSAIFNSSNFNEENLSNSLISESQMQSYILIWKTKVLFQINAVKHELY